MIKNALALSESSAMTVLARHDHERSLETPVDRSAGVAEYLLSDGVGRADAFPTLVPDLRPLPRIGEMPAVLCVPGSDGQACNMRLTYIVNRLLINAEMERPFADSRCIFAVFNSEDAHHHGSDSVPA